MMLTLASPTVLEEMKGAFGNLRAAAKFQEYVQSTKKAKNKGKFKVGG